MEPLEENMICALEIMKEDVMMKYFIQVSHLFLLNLKVLLDLEMVILNLFKLM